MLAWKPSLPAVLEKIVELARVSPTNGMGRWGARGRRAAVGLHHRRLTDKQRGAIGNLPVGEGILGS